MKNVEYVKGAIKDKYIQHKPETKKAVRGNTHNSAPLSALHVYQRTDIQTERGSHASLISLPG